MAIGQQKKNRFKPIFHQGFALPLVVVISVLMLGFIAFSMQMVNGSSDLLRKQHRDQIAREAVESGLIYAEHCIARGVSINSSDWPNSSTNTLDTGDDCNGNPLPGLNCNSASPDPRCFIVSSGSLKTTFKVEPFDWAGGKYSVNVSASVGLSTPSGLLINDVHKSNLVENVVVSQYGLSTGNDTSCSIISGALYCWGKNGHGQVGDGTTTHRLTPYRVSGALAGKYVHFVASGMSHTCAIAGNTPNPADGNKIYCWGDNSYYQYGNNNKTSSTVPVLADSGAPSSGFYYTGVSGRDHTCVMTTTTSGSDSGKEMVHCWGMNNYGESGEKPTKTETKEDPRKTRGDGIRSMSSKSRLEYVSQIASVSANFSCAINKGKIRCWGLNTSGQRGTGVTSPQSVRAETAVVVNNESKVVDLTDASKIATNNAMACAVSSFSEDGGRLYCWGRNQKTDKSKINWQLDSGDVVTRGDSASADSSEKKDAKIRERGVVPTPTRIINKGPLVDANIKDVALVDSAGCVLVEGDASKGVEAGVYCWGYNNRGQLGQGNRYDYPGQKGSGTRQQLGSTTPESSYLNVRPASDAIKVNGGLEGKEVRRIVGGNSHFCAITASLSVYCWGYNEFGQIGDGTTTDALTPVKSESHRTVF